MVKPVVVKVTGKVSQYGPCQVTDTNKFYDFEIIAPFKEGDDLPGDVGTAMEFSACILKCGGVEDCNNAMQAGVPQCPSERSPGQFQNHFGGQPGFISLDEANENVQKIREGEE